MLKNGTFYTCIYIYILIGMIRNADVAKMIVIYVISH